MSEWEPIETAPKDGTVIDVWLRDLDELPGYRVPDVLWHAGYWVMRKNLHFSVESFFETDTGEPRNKATHWMPKPSNPE